MWDSLAACGLESSRAGRSAFGCSHRPTQSLATPERTPAFLRNVIPALKPGGKVVIIDFYRRQLPVGPPLWAKLSEAEVKEDFLKEGFKLDKQLTFLPYQYFLIFTK